MPVKGNKGNLFDGNKDPNLKPGKHGLDWGKIQAEYRARLEEERARGIDSEEHRLELDMTPAERERYLLGQAAQSTPAAASRRNLEKARKAKKEGGVAAGGRPPGPRFDVDEMVRLYTEDNLSANQIAKKMGIGSPTTVSNWLKVRKVWDRNKFRRQAVAPKRPPESYRRRDRCGKGHDLTLPGAIRERIRIVTDAEGNEHVKRSGADCVECGRERTREYRKKGKDNG